MKRRYQKKRSVTVLHVTFSGMFNVRAFCTSPTRSPEENIRQSMALNFMSEMENRNVFDPKRDKGYKSQIF